MYGNQRCPVGSMAYTIKSGDTFYTISRNYGVSIDDLLADNPGVNPDRLVIGQIICIPKVTPQPPTSKCPTLSMGSRGTSVTQVQKLLMMHGFNPGPIDGIFGSMTQSAVIAFQRSRNLVADGIVGIMTWTALGVNCQPEPTNCPIGTTPYTIKAGDSFYKIAQRYNTTVEAIRKANPTVNPDNLQVGQVLCIP